MAGLKHPLTNAYPVSKLKRAAGCCREKVRRQVHVKFNNWELEDGGGAWLEMEKADAPNDAGADWW